MKSISQFFLLAMVLHPHALKKMQEEIDAVMASVYNGESDPEKTGPPGFDEFGKLEWCLGVCKEVLRYVFFYIQLILLSRCSPHLMR